MLSVEDLVVIFGFLAHDALDAAEITGRHFASIVKEHFDAVVHCKLECVVKSQDAVVLSKYAGLKWAVLGGQQSRKITVPVSDLASHLRRAAVHSIRFECVVDTGIVNMLQPFKDKFSDASCTVPCKFTTLEAFLKAFALVLFCDEFAFSGTGIIGSAITFEDGSPSIVGLREAFFMLPCFKQCSVIHMTALSNAQFPVKEVADWLNASNGKKKKELFSLNDCTERTDFAGLLVDFVQPPVRPASKSASTSTGLGLTRTMFSMNAFTEEKLTVVRYCDEYDLVGISVKRVPMKAKSSPGPTL